MNKFIKWTHLLSYKFKVFPNEYGNKKHPLFFMDCIFNKKNAKVSNGDKSIDLEVKNSINKIFIIFIL